MISSIIEKKEAGAQEILQEIVDNTNGFIKDSGQSDDITFFVIKRKKESI